MKKNLLKFCFALFATALVLPFVSCSSDDNVSVKQNSLAINFTLPSGISADSIENVKVILTKSSKTDTISLGSPKDTTIIRPQGEYRIDVTGKVKDKLDALISGTSTISLYANTSTTITLSEVLSSPLIFKSIYTTGGKAGYVVDSYFEIVNNSDEVQYLDGLIISSPMGHQKVANAWQANGYINLYESGQGVVVAFPGTGKEHPLLPGQSVLIANNAAKHDTLAASPNYCPDLTQADWEIYVSNVTGEIDYAAPNLDVIFQNTQAKAFGLGFFGRAYLLAKLPEGTSPKDFAADASNIMTTPGTQSTMQFLMIPSKYVLDAVDIVDGSYSTYYPSFLPVDDAYGITASTAWSGKCVRRKVTKITTTGRVYYKDTNKSSDDFLNNEALTPGVTPTTVDQ